MDNKIKLRKIREITEDELRKEVLIPLLGRMGLKAPTIYHGSQERGKDVVCFDYDKLGKKVYLGIVAKVGDFTGSLSSNKSLSEILFQIEQSFDVPYYDLFGMNKITMDQVWVVTTGRIVTGAAESILDKLQKTNLAKLVRFISGENLVHLINEHYNSYWGTDTDSKEYIAAQRDRAIKLCCNLLKTFGAGDDELNTITTQILNCDHIPGIIMHANRFITSVGSYSIHFDEICEKYNHNFYSGSCGLIKDEFINVRKSLHRAISSVEDVLINYEYVIGQTDPENFIRAFYDTLMDEYPFRIGGDEYSHDVQMRIQSLDQSLREIENFLDLLEEKNRKTWALTLIDSVEALKDDIKRYIDTLEKDEFELYWQIVSYNSVDIVKLVYEDNYDKNTKYNFITKHVREVYVPQVEYWKPKYRLISERDIIAEVEHELHKYIRQSLNCEIY